MDGLDSKTEVTQELTDGFHLIIDALKLNGINNVYHVPGIPVTDLGRMMQAEGMRVISFRHESNAGNAAAIAGYLTRKPGICLTVSAPGFLNGLVSLAHATTNCWPMILISGSSEREVVDLQKGDYEEMDQLAVAKAPLQGSLSRSPCRGRRHRNRPGNTCCGLGPAWRRLSRHPRQPARAGHGCGGRNAEA